MPTHHKNYKKSTKSLTKRKSRITKKTKRSKKTKKSKKIKSRRHHGKNLTRKQLLKKLRLQKGGQPPIKFGPPPPNIGPLFPNGGVIRIQNIYSNDIKFISDEKDVDLKAFIKNTVLDRANIDTEKIDVKINKNPRYENTRTLNVNYLHNAEPKLTDEIVSQIRENIDEYLKDEDMIVDVGRG